MSGARRPSTSGSSNGQSRRTFVPTDQDLGEHTADLTPPYTGGLASNLPARPDSIDSDGEIRTPPVNPMEGISIGSTMSTTTKIESDAVTFSGKVDELAALWFYVTVRCLLDDTLNQQARKCAFAAALFRGDALTWLARQMQLDPTILSDFEKFKNLVDETYGMSEEMLTLRMERELLRLRAPSGKLQEFTARFDALASQVGLDELGKKLLYTAKLPVDIQDRVLLHDEVTDYAVIKQGAIRYDVGLAAIKNGGEASAAGKGDSSRSKKKTKKQQQPGPTKVEAPKATLKAEVKFAAATGAVLGGPPAAYIDDLSVAGRPRRCLVDNGSAVNMIRWGTTAGFTSHPSNVSLTDIRGKTIQSNCPFILDNIDHIPQRFYLVYDLQDEVILGRPYLEKVKELDVFTVDLTGPIPDCGPLRPLSDLEQEALDEALAEERANGWIRPSRSPVKHGFLFVPKKNGKLRFCINYKPVNSVTKRDGYPLPLLWELLRRATVGMRFTVIDCAAAFRRISVRTGDEWKLAFMTNRGQFEYVKMPFGVTNGPSTQQRFLDAVLEEHREYAVWYVDDILVFTAEEPGVDVDSKHKWQYEAILDTLQAHGVKTNTDKMQKHLTKVTYLGVSVENNQLEPVMDTEAIRDWPLPSCVNDVQQFLGVANWFRPFAVNLSTAADRLYSLTGKAGFHWDSTMTASFEEVKVCLLHFVKVRRFQSKLDIEIYTDASQVGLGALLVQDGRVIAILSKSLSPAQRNYTTTERELLAVVMAVKKWRHYIESSRSKVTVRTDHMAITQQLNKLGDNRRLNRMILLLGTVQLHFEYCPGKNNPADYPSRRPDFAKVGDSSTSSEDTLA